MANPLKEKPAAEEVPLQGSAGVMLNGQYMAPPEDKDGKRWTRTSMLIQATPEQLYELWRNVESAPLWQEQIVEVRTTGANTSHWVMKSDPDSDKTIEWDSEILADEPGKRITWRSTGGDSDNAGQVVFEPAVGGRGTVVTVLQEFRMGMLASAWETIMGRNPKQSVTENLRHLKALAETGEIPRTEGQPHGPRGVVGSAKKSMYGENVDVPPGINQLAS